MYVYRKLCKNGGNKVHWKAKMLLRSDLEINDVYVIL